MKTSASGPCHTHRRSPIRLLFLCALAGAILTFTLPAQGASDRVLKSREHRQLTALHARVGTTVFFHNHRFLLRGRTRPIALEALRVAHVWIPIIRRELRETRAALHPKPRFPKWLVDAFTCIHGHEGAWNSETGNGFHGGLQMDDSFQSTYGPEFVARWGNAGNWPIWAQLTAAIRAHDSGRGFGPWPNTARYCGLL